MKELNIYIVSEFFVEEMNKIVVWLVLDVSEIDKISLYLEKVFGMKILKIFEVNIVFIVKLE